MQNAGNGWPHPRFAFKVWLGNNKQPDYNFLQVFQWDSVYDWSSSHTLLFLTTRVNRSPSFSELNSDTYSFSYTNGVFIRFFVFLRTSPLTTYFFNFIRPVIQHKKFSFANEHLIRMIIFFKFFFVPIFYDSVGLLLKAYSDLSFLACQSRHQRLLK